MVHLQLIKTNVTARLGLVLATLMLGTTSGLVYATQATASPAPTVARCRHGELNLSMGPVQGAAGTFFADAILTNQGDHTCFVGGYPTVLLKDKNNATIGNAADHNAVYPFKFITLEPGQSAHALVGFPDPSIPRPKPCANSEGVDIQVTPNKVRRSLETPLNPNEKWCPGFRVSRVAAGQ